MDARRLTRLTSAALVTLGGLAAGHLLLPARPAASLVRQVAFVALMGLLGAVAAIRERALVLEYTRRAPGPLVRWVAAGAAAAIGLAAAGWWVVHG